MAAIRETFEEVGLLLAYDKAGELVGLTDPDAISHFAARRQDLERRRTTFNAFVRDERLTLAADRMAYFSHWITPEGAPRRYDTRFFVAVAPPAQEPLHDNREAVSHLWVAAAALDRHHVTGEFKMRFPTVRTLELFAGYDSAAELVAALRRQRPIPAILPRIHADGRRLLPGEATDREEHLSLLRKRQQWKGLKSVVRIVSERKLGKTTEVQTRYFISSLPADAKTILKAKRSHWKIENQVHWVLDISFREDQSPVRTDHAAENLALLRHMALNLLKHEKTAKGGIRAKRLQAGWDNDYLLTILRS